MSLFGTNTTSGSSGLGANSSSTPFSFGGTGTLKPSTNFNSNEASVLNQSSLAVSTTTTKNTSGNNSNLAASINNSSNSSKLLKDLLESAHNLPKSENNDLGSIHLTLKELQRKSHQLRKLEDKKDVNFTKAHYLLASSGISAEEIENELNSINVVAPSPIPYSIQPGSQETSLTSLKSGGTGGTYTSTNNIESYLNSKKEENILNTIEQSLALASKDFDNYISSKISIDWKLRRDELRKSVGLKKSSTKDSSIASQSALKNSIKWNKSIPGTYNILSPLKSSTNSNTRQFTREKFENHARIVYQLNEARLSNKNYPLCLHLGELNKLQNDLKSKQISEIWKILTELTNEKFSKTSQEYSFYKISDSTIISSSRNYLESEFFNYIEELYLKDSKKSSEFLPGTNLNKVSYFINKIISKDHLSRTLNVNGTPIWALIFYLLRSGSYNDALDLTIKNRDVFNKFDSNFPVYLKKYVESENHTLPSELVSRLHSEFNEQFQFLIDEADIDPFKYSVYKIIGRCDLSKKTLPSSLNLSIEDWLWFHLSLINEHNESDLIFDNYSLINLQHKIISLGPKNFNSSSNNPLYLKSLALVGLYELAVQYTYDNINECDAVHLAIALNYYGLLKVSSFNNKDDLLILHNNEIEINFSRLLGSYTRSFKISDPKVACQYLILIAMSKGEVNKCHEALRELILISREFSMLLGEINEINEINGSKIPGILERQRSLIKLDDLSEFYHQIIELSAIKCEEEGRIFDAILLYQLCQEYDTVISSINKLLSEILSSTELDKPIIKGGNYEVLTADRTITNKEYVDTIDNNVILFSRHIVNIFNKNSSILTKINPQKKATTDTLLPIIDIRDLFLNKDFRQVLTEISKLNLLPVDPKDDLIKIRGLSELIHNNNLDDNLIKVIPSLLIMVMTCVSQLNYTILTKRYQSLGNEKQELDNLKKIANNCMVYAGMVQYKMPRETYSLLIQLESSL
ncbi:Nup93/Nic96-domain-containing protein [Scheffersomyces amazonensis]|uniref:Nup93/Nic96-domain-containing protein n=1 Tax=Scheffersomyces amazonensis TaxID=1078765 RepID=UPI00315CE25A